METPTPHDPTDAASASATTALSRMGARRFSAFAFLIALSLWIVSTSFLLQVKYGFLIEVVLGTLVFLSAVLVIGGRRRTLVTAILLVIPAFICMWIHHLRPDVMPAEAFRIAGMLFIAFVTMHLLRFVLRAPQVTSEVLCAAISVYLLIAIFWGFAYILAAELVPGSFVFSVGPASGREMVGFEAVYFSFVTLTTVGYGDVTPVSNAVRMLAIAEATVGMFYVTILIARLVSVYSAEKPPRDPGNGINA